MRAIMLILYVLLLATACQKRKYPDDKVQMKKEEIFFDGLIDNEPVDLKVGENGYYCYSSYKQSDSVYMFEGELKKFDCNPCPRSLKVELSDYRQRAPGASIPSDSTLRKGSRGFIPGLSKAPVLKFLAHSNKNIASVRWELSNGFTSQDPVLNYAFEQPGEQVVSLTLRTTGNCESKATNKIYVGSTGIFACSVTVDTENHACLYKPGIIGGKAPFRYTWYFGDGATSNLAVPSHSYTWAGSYPVKLRVEDAENHICESDYLLVYGNDNSSCTANMTLSHLNSKSAFLNGVRLQWTDQSNVVLRSDSVAQPVESYFEVVDSKAYEPNERGEAGRLLTLRFNVLLANGSRKIWFKSEGTAIAVSYK